MSDPRINGARLWDSLMEMGRIGATAKGGVGRLALTDFDKAARDLFREWCEDAGCAIRVDQAGNIFARRAGRDDGRAPVMTGSHLDTQPLGGKFDGPYGVLAGLEVVRTLNDAGIATRAPIEIVDWTDEEGARFAAGTVGSGVFAGKHALEAALGWADAEGRTVAAELARIGYAGTEPVGGFAVDCFFEAHIEQGPILENEGKTVGVVLAAQGQRCFRITVDGEEGHAGTLPMELRKDALLGAARMIDAVNRIAFDFDPHPVITVGNIQVRPNSRNTISGRTVFTIDSRHPDNDVLARVRDAMSEACQGIAAEAGLGLHIEPVSHRDTIAFDGGCIDLLRSVAARLDVPHQDIYSGAGHDACNMALVAPTGMIFVPCERGISHNEEENARPEDLAAGCDVLLHVLLERAGTA